MSESEKPKRTLPLFLIKPKTMTPKDIRRAERLGGICIVECEDPGSTRLLEPPVNADVPAQARAALKLFRWISTAGQGNVNFARHDMIKFFVETLISEPEPQRVDSVKKK